MTGGSIRGITISFRGDTTKLDKALRQVQSETRALDKELKAVDRALKFNPTNVDLWRQKQQILTQKITETQEKLRLLKDAQAQMDASGVDKNSAEYRQLQREIIETESQLKTFKNQLKQVGNVKLRALSEQFKDIGSKLESAGNAMKKFSAAGAAVVASLGAMSYKAGAWADDLNTMSKVYGIGTDDLQKYAASAALVDVEVETIASTHRRLTKAMAGTEDETGAQAEAFAKLGVETRNTDGSLRDSDQVWQEVIASLGTMENETERDAIAMELMGKSAADLNPLIEDAGKTYQQTAELFNKYGLEFVDQETLDKANAFNDSIDQIKAIGLITFQSLGAELAGVLAPALEKVVDFVGRIAGWLSQLDPQVLIVIGTIAGVVAVMAPLLIGLGKVAFAISSIMNLVAVLGPIISGLSLGPMALIVTAIGAAIAVGVALYKNWDTIKAKAEELKKKLVQIWNNIKSAVVGAVNGLKSGIVNAWNNIKSTVTNMVDNIKSKVTSVFNSVKSSVTSIWNGIKNAIKNPIETAKNAVSNAISRIKSLLSGTLSFPHIKLPHFKITGSFSLNPPSVPHLGVDWYDRGGIFSRPSIIGVGEKRPEFVGALDDLRSIVREESGGVIAPTINIYGASGQDVKALAKEVERVLVKLQKQRNNTWASSTT